jgi:hypothetical protein
MLLSLKLIASDHDDAAVRYKSSACRDGRVWASADVPGWLPGPDSKSASNLLTPWQIADWAGGGCPHSCPVLDQPRSHRSSGCLEREFEYSSVWRAGSRCSGSPCTTSSTPVRVRAANSRGAGSTSDTSYPSAIAHSSLRDHRRPRRLRPSVNWRLKSRDGQVCVIAGPDLGGQRDCTT